MKETQASPNVEPLDGVSSVDKVGISRRTYLRRSLMAGTALAGSGTLDFFDTFTTMSVAHAQGNSFSFAWVSDTHLYPRTLNTRFIDKAVRAFKEVQDMGSRLDFMIFGGDLAQLGDPVEIALGADLLKEVKIK